MNNRVQHILVMVMVCGVFAFAKAQSPQPDNKAYESAMAQGLDYAADSNFPKAEAAYRKAKAVNPQSVEAPYNLGNLYYENKKGYNAIENYTAAATKSTSKAEKHKAFHNLGNTFMEAKQFSQAVEAYKNALRNDPTDDETRYNLALAKQEKEKQGGGGGGDDKPDKGDNKDENKNKDGDQDEKSGGDNKGENEKEGKDKEGDKGDDKNDPKGENQEGKDGDGKPNEQKDQQQKRVEGQMTPQQIRQILEAMNNEEQKIQDKINAQKVKGRKKTTEKDW
ncbi:tetratricopeptide repeat protein [Nonlabens marinus]|nr:tetratricopeptide repeat protein [Nonlabens marinus]